MKIMPDTLDIGHIAPPFNCRKGIKHQEPISGVCSIVKVPDLELPQRVARNGPASNFQREDF